MEARIEEIRVRAFQIPTDAPESDGTYEWTHTILVIVHARGGGDVGLGYTYADRATAHVIEDTLSKVVVGTDAMNIPGAAGAMVRSIRNLGRPGIASMAISAVDAALWDLKARILRLPLMSLLGATRDSVEAYGSGGFTSYDVDRLRSQLSAWAENGMKRVKMKIGRDASADRARVGAVRAGLPSGTELFVDANGAYGRKEALAQAEYFADYGVTWFEEPVSSDDLEGLRLLRRQIAGRVDVAAGEYGYEPFYFQRMLDFGAVDVLQADASRCGGPSGFLAVDALCDAHARPLSAHCAPQLHAHLGCASKRVVHLEYFHDHARIETMLFDGALVPKGGALMPDRTRPGIGIELKEKDARAFAL